MNNRLDSPPSNKQSRISLFDLKRITIKCSLVMSLVLTTSSIVAMDVAMRTLSTSIQTDDEEELRQEYKNASSKKRCAWLLETSSKGELTKVKVLVDLGTDVLIKDSGFEFGLRRGAPLTLFRPHEDRVRINPYIGHGPAT